MTKSNSLNEEAGKETNLIDPINDEGFAKKRYNCNCNCTNCGAMVEILEKNVMVTDNYYYIRKLSVYYSYKCPECEKVFSIEIPWDVVRKRVNKNIKSYAMKTKCGHYNYIADFEEHNEECTCCFITKTKRVFYCECKTCGKNDTINGYDRDRLLISYGR
jgi:hypothetical protein